MKAIDAIKAFFNNNEWKYNYNEKDNVFISGIDMGNIIGSVRMLIILSDKSYNVYMILNSKIEEQYFSIIAEFLHRVNYGLNNGNFEIDYRDGEIRYKTYVSFIDGNVSEEIVADSIIVGAAMINRYGKGLMQLMLGDGTPEEWVEYCERTNDEI